MDGEYDPRLRWPDFDDVVWPFSDVFEEQGVIRTPFYLGFGLIAERGTPKAAFRAFELRHRLGDQRLDSGGGDWLLSKKPDGTLVKAIWNYAEPGQSGSMKTVRLRLRNARKGRYTVQLVGPGRGSALEEWVRMGSPLFSDP